MADGGRSWVTLEAAKLCLNCEAVFEGAACPSCARANSMPIRRWVDPVDGEKATERIEPAALERWKRIGFGLLGLAAGVLIGKGNRPQVR